MDDLQLIAGLINGDDACCRYFYKKNLPAAKKYILNNSGDEDDAKDTFQDAVADLIDNLRKGKYVHKGKLEGYFFIMVKNKWHDKLDKMKTWKKHLPALAVDEDTQDDGVTLKPAVSLADFMNRELNKLGERCRAVITATIYIGMSMEKAAEELGFPTAHAVRQKKLTCLKEMRGFVRYEDVINLT